MKKSVEQDINKLNSIVKSIGNIKMAFDRNTIDTPTSFRNDELTQLACTQLITNIYEAKKKLQDETFDKLTTLNKIDLSTTRNIASHDYDRINFNIIYELCKRLTRPGILAEIYKILAELEPLEDELDDWFKNQRCCVPGR